MKVFAILCVVLMSSCGGCVDEPPPAQPEPGEGEGEVGEGEGEPGEGEGEVLACIRTGCDDCDRDTFYTCIDPAFPQRPQLIDCDDDAFSVQPGGADFWDNGIDDNCDGVVDERTSCDCLDDTTAESAARALGACTVRSTATYGLSSQRFVTENYYGVASPNPGCMLAMSSGLADPENGVQVATAYDAQSTVYAATTAIAFYAPGNVICELEDGSIVEPCISPVDLLETNAIAPGMHVLTVRSVDENGVVQSLTTPIPVVGESTVGLVWPVDSEPVQPSSTVWVQGAFGEYPFFSLQNNGVVQYPSSDFDETGMVSFVLSSGGPIADGDWQIVDDAAGIVVGTVVVASDGAKYSGARYSTFEGVAGASTYVCIIDDQEQPCGDIDALPVGLHRLQLFGLDNEGNQSPVPFNAFIRSGTTTAQIIAPADGSSGGASPTLVFTYDRDEFYELAIDGESSTAFVGAFGVGVTPSARLNLTPGAHEFAIRDFGGNTLASSTYTVVAGQGDPSNFAFPTYAAVFDVTSVQLETETTHPVTGVQENDLAGIQMRVVVPANARGVAMDSMFVSVEWPDYLCSDYNDKMDIYLVSDATGRQPSNIAIDPNGAAITVNNGYFELPSAWTSDLAAVPYARSLGDDSFSGFCGSSVEMCTLPTYCDGDQSELAYLGSGTGWLVAQGPVRPGETIDVLAVVSDAGDYALDSLMLLSGLRWLPEPPPPGILKPETVGEVTPFGEMPQQP
jgi:hypothetical protein